MHHFFVSPEQIGENSILIKGNDVNHIKNVLRMKPGEKILISDGAGCDYNCEVESLSDDSVTAKITDIQKEAKELPAKLVLFQALPKNDKMELIIQKAVELGAYEIVPVNTSRCVVKLDSKKEQSKLKRWNSIAESAAKQSKRSIIPQVRPVLSFDKAIAEAKDMEFGIIPYENFEDMTETKQILAKMPHCGRIGIFIGPEGGFSEKEVELALESGIRPVSLGKRILRTETAGLAILSVLMFSLED